MMHLRRNLRLLTMVLATAVTAVGPLSLTSAGIVIPVGDYFPLETGRTWEYVGSANDASARRAWASLSDTSRTATAIPVART